MRAIALLLALACGACRSSYRFEAPPDHPARPEARSAQLPPVPDAARVAPSGKQAGMKEDDGEDRHGHAASGKDMK